MLSFEAVEFYWSISNVATQLMANLSESVIYNLECVCL